ncbi:impB/mucB/samB family protein [Hirsutella rhossiliensis]|uniref:ImpB/mucB/samB family domain-containing protein n=1 Tax=Hirsutella rhossiliensis TaxID=111463 RepID=A0A9P8SMM7_9HYPO|nr:impB/mucB/samB family domain-containing protein [Hirsutella rhossiliensis]KAH0967025.1 impB/mucB/samB family domain-containing protein [Hirsutella rhossiliensis]
MEQPATRPPKRRDDRVILQFDYDCFYAQVFENKDPALRSRPLGIKQKNILATCNYNARRQGVRKLMLISEATQICPNLVLVDGEDLTPFRDVSKMLFTFLRSYSWNNRVERLGFDEVFMDVTDIVDYNMSCLNRLSLAESFFCLSRKDPELGFNCDLTSIAGCVVALPASGVQLEHHTYLRLLLGSHLAHHLRLKLETDFGYTATCGIATNKLLSKLVGSCNKPRNQTTLPALQDDDVAAFMDGHKVRQVPGLGFKTALLLESHVLGRPLVADSHSFQSSLTVGQVRRHQAILSPGNLETILGGPGAEKGVGQKVWGLLHGVDPTEVKEASDIPSQVSIEDTYKGLETIPQIIAELHKLSCSLVRRMRIDLVVRDDDAITPDTQKWIARPKTLRLSIRSWPIRQGSSHSQNRSFSRVSRSGPLPNFIFDLEADIDDMAQQLVAEALLPLLRRMQSDKEQRWNLQLLNICVVNMVPGAADDRTGAGRDIGVMFKKQDEVLLPWRVTRVSENESDDSTGEATFEELDMNPTWDNTVHPLCQTCGHFVPQFAMPAHARYHELED